MPSSAWKKIFFNDTATTEIYTFPYTTLFRSAKMKKCNKQMFQGLTDKDFQEIIRIHEQVCHNLEAMIKEEADDQA